MKEIIIFGFGNSLSYYIDVLEKLYKILFLCDSDPNKWGKRELNDKIYEVKSPECIKEYLDTAIFVVSIHWEEIVEHLYEMGCSYVVVPMSKYPLRNDPNCYYELEQYINGDPGKWYGNRTDFDYVEYGKIVYSGWNDHLRLHFMLKRTLDYGYLPSNTSLKILDYGCGVGTLCLSALLRGYDCYGVEVEEWKYAFLKKKIGELSYPKDWKERFLIYDGNKLPFEDASFDVVFTYQVLEHVIDLEKSVREILRILKPEGFAYLHCPNYDRTYEEHYMFEFGKPLRGNKEEFKKVVKAIGADCKEVDNLNFINKDDVKKAIKLCGDYSIVDLLNDDPLSDIDFIVKKHCY